MARAAVIGDRLMRGLRDLAGRHPSLGDVRGRGLMIGLEVVHPGTRERDPDRVRAIVEAAFRKGLLILGTGPSALRLAPPMIVDETDADLALSLLDSALAETR
jgi:4-aminobutyrate aminotransferase